MTEGPISNLGGEKLRRPKAWLVYGGNGHEKEYIFSTEKTGSDPFLPAEIGKVVQEELGKNWAVADRGTRIEITCKNPYGARNDERVGAAFEKALRQLEQKYNFLTL